jgi:hypothetical protein
MIIVPAVSAGFVGTNVGIVAEVPVEVKPVIALGELAVQLNVAPDTCEVKLIC